MFVGAGGEIDLPHASFTDGPQQPVWPNLRSRPPRLFILLLCDFHNGMPGKSKRPIGCGPKRLQLA